MKLWPKIKKILTKIGEIQSLIILGVIYFVLITPYAFVLRATGKRFMPLRPEQPWNAREKQNLDETAFESQG